MRYPQNAFRVGGKQYYVAEDHQRPVMEHWGCLLYISQNLGVGWGGEGVRQWPCPRHIYASRSITAMVSNYQIKVWLHLQYADVMVELYDVKLFLVQSNYR